MTIKSANVLSPKLVERLALDHGNSTKDAQHLVQVYRAAQKSAPETSGAGNIVQRSIAMVDSYNRDVLNSDPDGFHFYGDSIRACQDIHDLLDKASLTQLKAAARKVRADASARDVLAL